MRVMKLTWSYMFEPPWRHNGLNDERRIHWLIWTLSWVWTLSGLVLGALVAPSLVQWVRLHYTQYQEPLVKFQDWLVIGVAVLAGFVLQLVGFLMLSQEARLVRGSFKSYVARLKVRVEEVRRDVEQLVAEAEETTAHVERGVILVEKILEIVCERDAELDTLERRGWRFPCLAIQSRDGGPSRLLPRHCRP
jgi:hypothetical protein